MHSTYRILSRLLRGPSSNSELYAELLFEDSRDRLDLSERGNVDGMYSTLRYESAERESSKIVGALLAKCSYLQYTLHISDSIY